VPAAFSGTTQAQPCRQLQPRITRQRAIDTAWFAFVVGAVQPATARTPGGLHLPGQVEVDSQQKQPKSRIIEVHV